MDSYLHKMNTPLTCKPPTGRPTTGIPQTGKLSLTRKPNQRLADRLNCPICDGVGCCSVEINKLKLRATVLCSSCQAEYKMPITTSTNIEDISEGMFSYFKEFYLETAEGGISRF